MTVRRPADREAVAIVGIGCRFPGASTPAAFWRLLVDGVDAIQEIPRDRFDIDALYDARPAQPGKVNTRWGGFVEGLDLLDAEFFGISPREAERLDPQQRMLLETSWEAIEDAGLVPASLSGTPTGVFVGMWINEYESRLFRNPDAIDFYATTGTGRYAASGRLSYVFGLQGPSLTLDTGCSSSLVAVHLACQSLWNGECELALAGAANAIVEPFVTIAYSQSGMMAPDGRCKFGDAAANGYVRSDGAAVIVLKPLARAIADGDPIYATILGSAVTNDGRGSGFMTTPAREGQEEMLRRAYRDAGVSPGAVHYVEAHGTGTRAGDPVELAALGAVLSIDRAEDAPCLLGSVKTNIGHTEGAAGMAGLIKTALSLKHRTIPASLHLQTPNPEIPWGALPLIIQQRTGPWPSSDAALAGVSSFGISGTNAHVVLSEAPVVARDDSEARPAVLTVSGHTPDALTAMVRAWREITSSGASAPLSDLGFTAAVRRTHHPHRAAFAAAGIEQLVEQFDGFLAGEAREGVSSGQTLAAARVAFVFPGQGSQWIGMGRTLYAAEPAFRTALDECDAAIAGETGWSVVHVLMEVEGVPALDTIDVIQPALFAVQVALAALWRSWGVSADAVVGHSMGEVAAAYVSGALSLTDAARVICLRSRLMKRTSGHGAMALVELPAVDAAAEIAGREHLLSVAVCNSSRSSVLSGDPAALDAVLAQLETRGVFCRRIKVDVASHSPQMDPLCSELSEGLASVQPRDGSIALYSTVLSRPVRGAELDRDYWTRNLRKPVMFADAVQRLIRDGHTVFIEMSPHPILTAAVREGLADAGTAAVAIASTKRDEDERLSMLGSLGAAYVAGVHVDWAAVYPHGTRAVATPPYAFQRERFWIDPPRMRAEVADAVVSNDVLNGALYTPGWAAAPRAGDSADAAADSSFLLVGEGPFVATLRTELEARGAVCGVLARADHPQAMSGAGSVQRIVYLAPFDQSPDTDAARSATWELVQWAAALTSGQLPRVPALTLVTSATQRAVDGDRVAGFVQGALWGAHRAAADEYPALDGGLIDVDDQPDAIAAASLARELLAGSIDQVALRGESRFVLRLQPRADIAASRLSVKPGASYLISGGLGELGLEVANWLADRGARRLILAGRTPSPPRAEWRDLAGTHPAARRVRAVQALEAKGVSVHVVALDVSDGAAVQRWLDAFREEAWPAIRGVVHCAGVLKPELLANTSAAALESVLAPKIGGTLALHTALAEEPLDFFVLFSSIASILPAPGQVGYAAANAFLDSFAQHLRASGRAACAINWAAWDGLGMAAALGAAEQTSSRGVATIPVEQARAALDAAMTSNLSQIAVTPFVRKEWCRNVFPPSTAAFQSAALIDGDAGSTPTVEPSLDDTLKQIASAAARRDHLEQWIRARVATVLGRAAARIELDRPLRSMGLDSLLGLQLRTELEKATGLKLPATVVWNYPTVTALAQHLADRLEISLDEPAHQPAAGETDLDDLFKEIAALPEEEVRRLLAERM